MRNNSSRSNSNGGAGRRGPRREQKKNMDYEARSTRNGVSANHLLNFSLPEREKPVYHHHQKKKKSSAPRTQSEYLHANYRFVISPLGEDAVVPTWDLEALTEWTTVEQVLLWYDDESQQTCPICMDTFRAPKITKCGHIFCWPCILRYLSMTDKYWRRCPMCFESVQKGHLRSVQLQQLQLPPHVGTEVTFQFLERPKSSKFPQLRAFPRTEVKENGVKVDASLSEPSSALRSPEAAAFAERKRTRKLPSVNDTDATYSRILESTPEYLKELLYSEMRDLQSMDAEFRSSGDVDNLPFVEEAMRNTSGRLAKSGDFAQGTHGGHHAANHASNSSDPPKGKTHPDNGEAYSFYQIANGTYVILHPLNMKCLLKEYSDKHQHELEDSAKEEAHQHELEVAWTQEASSSSSEPLPVDRYHLLPEQIHGRILDVEHAVMDEDAQKRYRFLSHLPRFCDFYICELDLTPQLSPSTLNCFHNDLKKRAKQRKHKLKLQHTAVPSSPVYKSSAAAFSLEGEGASWPALEQALAESLADFTLAGTDHTKLDDERHDAKSLHTDDQEGSFARVTENSGYFPALGSQASEPRAHAATSDPFGFGSPSAWGSGNPSTSPPGWDLRSTGKKKGGGKKGVPVFSTSQRRSYR
ncbi:RING finger protein 10 [Phytophthora boehmeriae]|uniref:RING finger protein 10 n=1 Tax=Phytophthora boehmeriae TaxID=109152 RepID=A0A8T1WYW7_9STRA|nr:RING finger protein 10 [Phytophthora boehmeriae]